MARLPLLGGSYSARSVIANAQRCINLFPESNPKDAPVPLTHYQRPGLRRKVQGALSVGLLTPVRCLYRASNGNGYAVIGQNVYSISAGWVLTKLGVLSIVATTPVTMSDNGINIMILDNSPIGYQIVLATNAFSQIVDATGTFLGGTISAYIDTFTLWNMLSTKQFGSTLSNSFTFDPLYFAAKTNYPDLLVGLAVCRREILLLGSLKSEIWFDAGNVGFPFEELPGASIEHGCCAPWSIAQQDLNVCWIGQNLQGQGMVLTLKGYEVTRISNHALEYALQLMPSISDAIGYMYQQGGHVFYVLNFPSGDQTWAYDFSTGEWAQRCWTDSNGVLHRDRGNCGAFINGINVVGDWENGTIYQLDPTKFTDDLVDVPGPITWLRTFPHIMAGHDAETGQPKMADGFLMQFNAFYADVDSGNCALDSQGLEQQISLRWSDDRGHTFGNKLQQGLGAPGDYINQPQWQGLGVARDRIFELSYSCDGPATLNGAWVEAEVLEV